MVFNNNSDCQSKYTIQTIWFKFFFIPLSIFTKYKSILKRKTPIFHFIYLVIFVTNINQDSKCTCTHILKTTHLTKFFFGCYYRILLLPFSVFYVYILGWNFIFLFPDTCVLRFILYAYSYTIHCFHGFYIHLHSLYILSLGPWIFELSRKFIHYANQTIALQWVLFYVWKYLSFLHIFQWVQEIIWEFTQKIVNIFDEMMFATQFVLDRFDCSSVTHLMGEREEHRNYSYIYYATAFLTQYTNLTFDGK